MMDLVSEAGVLLPRLARTFMSISGRRVMVIMIAVMLLFFLGILSMPMSPGAGMPWIAVIGLLACEGVYIGWLLCIGLLTNAISPAPLSKPPWVALATFPVAVLYMGSAPLLLPSEDLFPVVFPLHLLTTFFNFFVLWFASRSLHASELDRPPALKDYLPTLFVLWFALMFPPAVRWTHERVQASLRASGFSGGAGGPAPVGPP